MRIDEGAQPGQSKSGRGGHRLAKRPLRPVSPSTEGRKVAFAKDGMDPSVGHTLKVEVAGQEREASARTRIDLDAFVVVVLSRP